MPSSSSSDAQAAPRRQPYPYPSHVNAASFVNIKLSDKDDYPLWKGQMMCLIKSHDMLGFINGGFPNPKENGNLSTTNLVDTEALYTQWTRSDTLLKGWFFGSLGKDVLHKVISLDTAKDVWTKIETTYNPPKVNSQSVKAIEEEVDVAKYMPLYKAALMGDWEKAKEIFNHDNKAMTTKIDDDGYSALHVAVGTGVGIKFVENLLEKIEPGLLPTIVNNRNYTVLHMAAGNGNIEAAKMLVKKNPLLLYIKNSWGLLPMHHAAYIPHKATTEYLLEATKTHISVCVQKGYPSPFEGSSGSRMLNNAIFAGHFDMALQLLKDYPELATRCNSDVDTALLEISQKSDAYYSGTRYNFYERFIYSHTPVEESYSLSDTQNAHDVEKQVNHSQALTKRSCFHTAVQWLYRILWKAALLQVPQIKRIQQEKINHNKALRLLRLICNEVKKLNNDRDYRNHYSKAIIAAAENGSYEAVAEIIDTFPQAIWCKSSSGYYILQLAIVNRSEQVYNIFKHRLSDLKTLTKYSIDKSGNNILHLAGQLAPAHKLALVSGAALQMQRELQWYKEVEKFAFRFHKERKNSAGETPIMVFRKAHKELVKAGEEWMKKTADSYTITAGLIITIVFAAAITVPGGNNQDTGQAIFTKRIAFIIFATSDSIALFTSTTSLLLFLSILTTRFAEEDFLYALPKRLILGLVMLFMSVTSMMIAFSATLYLTFGQGKAWILIPVATLTCLPIASFVTLQFPLLKDLISSTYGPGIFSKQSGHRIY